MIPARVLLADPPWEYNDRREFRLDNPEDKAKFGIGAAGRYEMGCMSTDELCDMVHLVREVTTRDSYLLLWATCPRLPDCIRVGEAWGFEYKTKLFSWVKTTPGGKLVHNPGRYSHSNTEDVLLFRRRGSTCWHPSTGYRPHQVVMEPRPTADGKPIHSAKPEAVQDRLDTWLDPYIGGAPKIELFARRRRPGWVCMGGDISGNDIRYDLALLARLIRG